MSIVLYVLLYNVLLVCADMFELDMVFGVLNDRILGLMYISSYCTQSLTHKHNSDLFLYYNCNTI